jgi:hypothetical protein
VQVAANIDNVFDQDTWLSLYAPRGYGPQQYVNKAGGPGSGVVLAMPPAEVFQPNGFDINALAAAYAGRGGNIMPNPFWKTPNTYQGRRGVRLEARITF